jgi:hypothetical protein
MLDEALVPTEEALIRRVQAPFQGRVSSTSSLYEAAPRADHRSEPTIAGVEGSAGKSRLGSFLLGGLLGGLAGLAASRRRPGRQPPLPKAQPGLAAFEAAPCYQELLQRNEERSDRPR